VEKLKKGIILILIFILSVYSAFFFEEHFRELIRFLFRFFSNSKISFIYPRKYIHFATGEFVISFGIFLTVFVLILKRQTLRQKLINLFLTIFLFSISICIYSYFDSQLRLIECTNCINGQRSLNLNEIKYDTIFIISLIIGIIPSLITEIKRFNNNRKKA